MASEFLEGTLEQFSQIIAGALGQVPVPTPLPQKLFHFTDEDGLKGILRTRSLWASLATALEDKSEIAYALSCAKRLLEDKGVRGEPSLLDEILPFLDPGKSELIAGLGMKTYVVSFRTDSDASAHWESYGRSGTGCALAFESKSLVIEGLLLLPVLYERPAQDELLRRFIESSAHLYDNLLPDCPAADAWALRQRAITWTALGVWFLAPLLKGPSFREENEWRLIVVDPEHVDVKYGKGVSREVRVRRSNNRCIHYKVLQYDRIPVLGLEIGVNARMNAKELSQLLRGATGTDVPISRCVVVREGLR